MKVIGTAGHIDHGKSALVERLTGIDPDRLAEEKRRGMTIDLGFAWLALPSGVQASVIDVPGHERFIKNMLAGSGGVDVALLVVAADEGVMPQTREHVTILELLGVRNGVVALTKSDLVDDELLSLAAEDVSELLAGTSLSGSPLVPVSALTGDGIPDLLESLDAAVSGASSRTDLGLPLLPVDRVFTVEGHGTVVTGTLQDGRISVGDEVELVPMEGRARVRGIQIHGRGVSTAAPGQRAALNLAGIEARSLRRGHVVAAPGTVTASTQVTARLRVIEGAPIDLVDGTNVAFHIGAAESQATVHYLGAGKLQPGEEANARFRLAEPVAAVHGQRFILRLPDPVGTVGGGTVLLASGVTGVRADARSQILTGLSRGEPGEKVEMLLRLQRILSPEQVRVALRLEEPALAAALGRLAARDAAVRLGSRYASGSAWRSLETRVQDELLAHHEEHPLRAGMSKEELRRRARWPADAWNQAVALLVSRGVLKDLGAEVALPGHTSRLEESAAEIGSLLAALGRRPFSPPTGPELLQETGADAALLHALAENGRVVRVADGIYFAPDAYRALMETTLDLIDREGQVTVASLRNATGTSRKYALPLLEYFDAQRITRRLGDARVRGVRAPACA